MPLGRRPRVAAAPPSSETRRSRRRGPGHSCAMVASGSGRILRNPFALFLQTLHTQVAGAAYAECMNKARYVRSRWWVAASALGAFVAMFGALFAHDRDAFEATDAVEAAA